MRFPRKADLIEVRGYARAVVGHYISFLWFVFAGLLGIVSEFTGSLRFFPTWGWWTLAMVGLTVAQFRAYHDVGARLTKAVARAGDLDNAATKRAYLEEQIEEAKRMQEEVDADEFADGGVAWFTSRRRIDADLIHWENGVRAKLRRWFRPGVDRLFDSDEGLIDDEARQQVLNSPGYLSGYIKRRRRRLEEIRDQL